MRTRIFKAFFVLLLFLGGTVGVKKSLALDDIYQPEYSQKGQVLGIKDTLLGAAKNKMGEGLTRWMVGDNGVMQNILFGMIDVLIGLPEETPGTSGNTDGNFAGSSSIPPGAIIMPPGDWYFTGGTVGAAANMIAAVLSSPPASGVYYAYDVFRNLGIAPAYAADGIGFGGLHPILPIWKAFRNVAYSIFALVFIATGLMIMFRVKISPQAVLTIENALPKLLGALVLITFSYAIAGFMIDLMYVVIGLSISVLKNSGVNSPLLIGQSVAEVVAMKGGFFTIAGSLIMGWPMFALLGAVIGVMVVPFGTVASAGIGAILFAVVWLIIALFLFFKIILALIKTYINIIIQIIFSPIFIGVGALPTSSGGFGQWMKALTANLLVFPAMIIVMIIGSAIASPTGAGVLWYPPLMGPPDIPVVNTLSGFAVNAFVRGIIGIGFLLILPAIPDIVRKAMGIEDSGIGAMIGQALGPAKGIGSMAAAGAVSYGEGAGGLRGLGEAASQKFQGSRFSNWWNHPAKGTSRQKAVESVSKSASEAIQKKLLS